MTMIEEFTEMANEIKGLQNNSDKILRVLLEICKDIKIIKEFGIKK